ncbi:class I SAM-dependent DNA methyltransferase [Endozoicomonas elysicola]|uniref:Methyltransferase domain-containing protein n=1 Tax=Endozoicomonas elysicola TaxID=305900 RepID=A0A081K717_9GAMM|nr:class I SAM-dependent methyltransferase [Endozoicomonas elysicola]KEI69943.1 hypothetical protein GV64_03555 [Endozoicomonas elysicola]
MKSDLNFNPLAEKYQTTDQLPYRKYMEHWVYRKVLEELEPCSSLDLACGAGFYSGLLLEMGFTPVTGVDCSADMISLARAHFADKKNIKFIESRIEDFHPETPFNVITAGWLLNYCEDTLHLEQLCTHLKSLLSSEGTMIITVDCQGEYGCHEITDNVCAKIYHTHPLKDGESFRMTLPVNPPLDIYAVHFDKATIIQAMNNAGFSKVEWLPLSLDPKGIEKLGEESWQQMINKPRIGFLKVAH